MHGIGAFGAVVVLTAALAGCGSLPLGKDIALSPHPVDFGTMFVGDTKEESAVITNAGTAAVSVTDVSAGFGNIFAVRKPQLPLPVPPGEKKRLTVAFTPTNVGRFAGLLTIRDDRGAILAKAALEGFGIPVPEDEDD
jgi:hypothetical protein